LFVKHRQRIIEKRLNRAILPLCNHRADRTAERVTGARAEPKKDQFSGEFAALQSAMTRASVSDVGYFSR
jgi:hypothetical protein